MAPKPSATLASMMRGARAREQLFHGRVLDPGLQVRGDDEDQRRTQRLGTLTLERLLICAGVHAQQVRGQQCAKAQARLTAHHQEAPRSQAAVIRRTGGSGE
jgi:hypothetical protein